MARNLVKNPSGDEALNHWELTANGGDHWAVEDIPGAAGHVFGVDGVTKYFVTSFELCLKKQVIDLVKEGYTPDQLDAQPVIIVGDWYSGRTDCACKYELTVRLLNEKKEVIKEFHPDPVILKASASSWRQVIHAFAYYGHGLRFISLEHGGADTQFWKGWYGVRVTGTSVTLQI